MNNSDEREGQKSMGQEKKPKDILSKKRSVFSLAFLGAVIIIISILFVIFSFRREASLLEKESFFYPPVVKKGEANISTEKSNIKKLLEESGSMKKSSSEDWWVNSGGVMLTYEKEFSTNVGSLSKDSNWRKLYAKTNPRDTDEGYFPQNIFRLVNRYQWKNYSQQVYFNISKINLSQSEYRNESNGVLLFNRYQDGDNLYYTGLRVDGHVVIKKKIKDKYYTLAEKQIFNNGKKFDREKNPSLLPLDKWIGIKGEVENIDSETVRLRLYVDQEQNGSWQLALEINDSSNKFGNAPFLKQGYAGIRTDFMDVKFKNYSLQGL